MEPTFSMKSRNFILFVLANFLYYGAFYLYIPVLPQYVLKLGGSEAMVGIVGGAFGLSSIIVRPWFGRLADQKGRKLMMMIGSGAFAILFLGFGRVTNPWGLVALRLAHGLCLALYLAASAAYIADYAPKDRRGEVLGIYQSARVISMAIFPAIGIYVLKSAGGNYSTLFLATFIVALVCFFIMVPIRDMPASAAKGLKINLAKVFTQKVLFLCSLMLFGGSLVYGAILTFMPIFAEKRGVINYGIFFTIYAVATFFCRVLVGKATDKIGRRKVIIPFAILIAISVALFPLMHGYALLVLISVLFGFGYGALVPSLTALVIDFVKPEERGPALGFFSSFVELGITIGAMALGFMVTAWGYEVTFMFTGALMLVLTLVFALRIRSDSEASDEVTLPAAETKPGAV